jgi:subtilase family serine protease
MATFSRHNRLFPIISIAVSVGAALLAQSPQSGRTWHPLIVDRIDEARLQTLAGNTRPEATAQNDAGAAPGDLAMEHMLLAMRPSAEQAQALQKAIDDLHDPKSPTFHKWLTAAQFGQTYGAAQADLDTVTAWLQSHGMVVNAVYPSGLAIDFSGAAAQVNAAFHTSIHYLNVNGQRHVANMTDPRIPAALAPAVSGVASMHDFTPHAMRKPHTTFTYTYRGSTYQTVTPADLATIYDFTPLFQAGITGKGQTIAVIEDADLYSSADWTTFRSTFGLAQYTSGSLTTVQPPPASGANNCTVPGLASGDDGEAILDAEWASAAAPDAAIEVASCASTRATFGGLIALQNLINGAKPPSVLSLSYGECEAENGQAANAIYAMAYQQAVAEGISVFVAAGDAGAAACDAGATGATHGIGVSAFASTPNNVAVGGTDFGDTLDGTTSTYWSSTNTPTYGSALSYIPEIPWNDSCAGALLSTYLGYPSPYGSAGLCSSSFARQNSLQSVSAGSGGPSGCATGTSATGIVSGTCKGYAKPSWQAGVAGIPADGVRDLPDVSMFAGTGIWQHYYVFCWSDVRNGGASCSGDPSTWAGAGGTSFATPIVAGIQALVNQYNGGAQGNPNYVYYRLAATNASGAFHSVTRGDIAVNCGGTTSCYGAAAAVSTGGLGRHGGGGPSTGSTDNGVLSTSDTAYNPAFGAAAGWNFANGIGSLDAYQLVMNWTTGQ